MKPGHQQQLSDPRFVRHLAELASLVGELRPVYAVGYIATLQKEFGLDRAFPVPKFPSSGGKVTYKHQHDEVARGMRDARAGFKPSLMVPNEKEGLQREDSRA